MIKRNWFVCLFTKYKYFMACNSKRKFRQVSTFEFIDQKKDICGSVKICQWSPCIVISNNNNQYKEEIVNLCQNCTRTKYYKENK